MGTAERIKLFIFESRQELRRVNWPTREETIRLTVIVIGICLFIALFLGVFDFAFLSGLKWFLLFKRS
jgi:preprotein translocase subunit SecE